MTTFESVLAAFASGDGELYQILGLTVCMTLLSTGFSVMAGFPAGAVLASLSFPGKKLLRRIIQTCMGLPPVVAGLFVFLLLSRRGPMGSLQLLFSLPAMVIAQFLLIFPIVTSLTMAAIESRQKAINQTISTLGLPRYKMYLLLLWECRGNLLTVILTGFGRSLSEVGAVMMVGGNIQGKTRVMTTAIMLETSKGNFGAAIALGLVLLFLAFLVNVITGHFQEAEHD